MQPESSDGFASVGTILPKEKAALLPGGFFRFTKKFLLSLRFGGRGALHLFPFPAADLALPPIHPPLVFVF